MSGPVLLKDIKRRGIAPFAKGDISRHWSQLLYDSLDQAQVVVGDNVAEWFAEHKPKGKAFDPSRELTCIAPPFPFTWIEYAVRSPAEGFMGRIGIFIVAEDFSHDEDGGTLSVATRLAAQRRIGVNIGEVPVSNDYKGFGPMRWLLTIFPVVSVEGGGPVGPTKVWFMGLRPDGGTALSEDGRYANFALYDPDASPQMIASATGWEAEGFFTLSFLNCRNVTTTDHLPSRQERRQSDRKGDVIIKYKTLQIEPMKEVLRTEGGIAQNGLRKALHICRGHFSRYSEEKPLFGKYAGTFWVPSHVRGSMESGQVVKDYNVRAPKERVA